MHNFRLLLAVLVLFACQDAVESEQALPGGLVPALGPGMQNEVPPHLPAYELEWEKKVPGKADQYDDFRELHPQWYAITEPPTGNFRPMKEWEPMQAIVMTYSDGLVSDPVISQVLIDIAVNSLAAGEVWFVVSGENSKQSMKTKLKFSGADKDEIAEKVKYYVIPNNAFWFIDYGPLPLVDEDADTVAFADFRYYHQRVLDDAIPTRLGNQIGVTTYRSPFNFEGGNFQADGEEYCYFSERVYYYTGMSFKQVEEMMQTHYGCKNAVVLKDITNDGTGHLDMFFKLGAKHTVIIGEYTVVNDAENKKRMDDNAEIMKSVVYSDDSGPIEVFRLPFPKAKQGTPRTYINSTLFASADGSVKVNLWPMYTVDKDIEAEAEQVWEEALPDFEHIGIVSDQISLLSGAVHCVTRTVPALPFEKWVEDGECVDGHCEGSGDAYDWSCIPPAEEDPGCWGPKWKCLCNVCSQPGCSFSDKCGDGNCDGGEDCFTCYKDCACEEGKNCNLATGECDTCGDKTCDEGENCTNCAADCGCPANHACSFGVCTQYPCGGIMVQGCCDGNYLVYCQYGTLYGQDCGGDGCGWGGSQYDCGKSGEDPSGKYALDCYEFDYPTGCGDKECGDNGGGYSCGECPDSMACVEGLCEGCEAQCDGKECGDDGCGGSCGECAKPQTCSPEGLCVDEPEPDCAGKECGDDGTGGSCGLCDAGCECSEEQLCICAVPDHTSVEEVVSEELSSVDLAAPEDGVGQVDAGAEEPDDDDDDRGCAVAGRSNSLALFLFGLLLALLAGLRFRSREAA